MSRTPIAGISETGCVLDTTSETPAFKTKIQEAYRRRQFANKFRHFRFGAAGIEPIPGNAGADRAEKISTEIGLDNLLVPCFLPPRA